MFIINKLIRSLFYLRMENMLISPLLINDNMHSIATH